MYENELKQNGKRYVIKRKLMTFRKIGINLLALDLDDLLTYEERVKVRALRADLVKLYEDLKGRVK